MFVLERPKLMHEEIEVCVGDLGGIELVVEVQMVCDLGTEFCDALCGIYCVGHDGDATARHRQRISLLTVLEMSVQGHGEPPTIQYLSFQ